MDATPSLGLPLLAAAQAQKHVTHNEALSVLDALVQLACLDKDLALPPASPAEGDAYLVAAASPGGAWSGWSGRIARFQDGAWVSLAPRPGWLAFVVDEADLYTFAGGHWVSFRSTITALQNLVRLGVNATADATNRLAVKADGALFSWDDAAPGAGHMRLTLNKRLAANDLGLTFQTGYSTRAVLGTLGSDDFALRTSADGAAFLNALTVSAGSGAVAFPNAVALASTLAVAGSATLADPVQNLGTSTGPSTVGLANGATLSGATKTVNLGTGGAAGSTTTINLGSAVAGAGGTTVVNTPGVTFAGTVTAIDAPAATLSAGRLGIGGAAATATNVLSANGPAALLSNPAGGFALGLSKAAGANDAVTSYQSAFSTRALVGLLGGDDFAIKVSPDGAAYATGLSFARATGRAAFGIGLDAPAIGAVSPGTGAFTTLTATGNATLSPAGASVVLAPTGSGTVTIAPAATGTIDNVSVGATSAASGRFSRLGLVPAASDPATAGAALGQLAVNSTQTAIKWYNGAAWARINNFAKFAASTNFDNYVAAATWTKVQFNTADSNDQAAFVAANNRLVAPEAGLYALAAALVFKRNGASAPTAFEVQLYRNGVASGRGRAAATGTLVDGVTALHLSCALKLAANDTVEVYVRFTGADGYAAAADSVFSGQQLA